MSDLYALYTALTGDPPDEDAQAALQEFWDLHGESALPGFLHHLIRALLDNTPLPATPFAEDEQGWTWLVYLLADALPGSEPREEPNRFLLALPALKRAIVLDESPAYALVEWPEPIVPPIRTTIGTFDPSEDQIREWAYNPALRMTEQDEHAALLSVGWVPLYLSLASDPACPRGTTLLVLLDRLVSHGGGRFDRALLAQCRDAARAGVLAPWGRDLAVLLDYIDGQGAVTLSVAREIARIVQIGQCRPAILLREGRLGRWWSFTAHFPRSLQNIDVLYLCEDSGAMHWARRSRTAAELVAWEAPARRDDPMGKVVV